MPSRLQSFRSSHDVRLDPSLVSGPIGDEQYTHSVYVVKGDDSHRSDTGLALTSQ